MKKILLLLIVSLMVFTSCGNTSSLAELREEHGMQTVTSKVEKIVNNADGTISIFINEPKGYNLIYLQYSEKGAKEDILKDITIYSTIRFDTINAYNAEDVNTIDIDGTSYGYVNYLDCENFEIIY